MPKLPFTPHNVSILIVESDIELLASLRQTLSRDGYRILEARSAKAALQELSAGNCDLVILDVNLPNKQGAQIAKHLQSSPGTPFIILSDKSDPRDSVKGLLMGADDYIVKPLFLNEFSARVQAVLRRLFLSSSPTEQVVNIPPLKIDMMARTVWFDERVIHLSPIEYKILVTLAQSPGRTFTRQQLAKSIWHRLPNSYQTSLPVYVWRLRQKLEQDPRKPMLLTTVHGRGYRLVLPRA